MVPALRGMMGCDSVDYYIESPIDNNGCLVLLNTSRRDIQIQIIQADLNRNTSVIEEVGELIDSASRRVVKNNQVILWGAEVTGLPNPSPNN